METLNFLWCFLIVIFLGTKADAQCMTLLAHRHSLGGRRMAGINSLVDCAEHCLSDVQCHSVDFNKYDGSCWVHDRWRPVKRAHCPCHHLEKVLQCNQAAPECYSIVNKKTVYYGKKRTTASGIACQRWDKQTPHQHNMTNATDLPDESLAAAESFCRDPDGEGYPWCYTRDPRIRWSSCGVPPCTGPFKTKLVIDPIRQKTTWQHVLTTSTTPSISTIRNTDGDDGEKIHSRCNDSRVSAITLYNYTKRFTSVCRYRRYRITQNDSRVSAITHTSIVVVGCIAAAALTISVMLIIIRLCSCRNYDECFPHLKTASKDGEENVTMSCYSVFK